MNKIRKFTTIVFSIAILSILQVTYSYGNSQSLEQLFKEARQAPKEEAIAIYQRIIREYPGTKDAGRAQYYIGTLYFQQKKYDQAIEAYQRYIDNYPKQEPKRIAWAYYLIGNSYEEMLNFDMAKKMYEKIINEYPILAKSAQERLKHLDNPEYIKRFKMARKFDDLNEAMLHYENKEYHQAITKARELLADPQRDPEVVLMIHLHIADSYEKLNNRKQAIREYKKIIKLFPENEALKEAIQKRIKALK